MSTGELSFVNIESVRIAVMGMLTGALLAVSAPLAAQTTAAPGTGAGWHLVAAGGTTQYDYDCWFWSACDTGRANAGKLVLGYRFGHFGGFGVEAWGARFGRLRVNRGADTIELTAYGVNAVWSAGFGPAVQGLLRAGAADVKQVRSGDGSKRLFAPTFGLGLVVHLAPPLALELAWDVTQGEGVQTGTTTASAVTVGLRLSF